MLSKKMAFSLTSLITIFALAFMVTPAMAGEFEVKLVATGDVSAAANYQLDLPADGSLEVPISFDQAVTAVTAFAATYDKDGNVLGFPAVTSTPATASKMKTLTLTVTDAVAKVNIRINDGIASADPVNDDTSKALDVNVFLVKADPDGELMVYSMRRVDNPLLPATADTVQVIVTLSEAAKEFKKGNLSITDNATIADPVKLDPVPEDPNRYRDLSAALGRASTTAAPQLRSIYDNLTRDGGALTDDTATADVNESEGIHTAIVASPPMALTDALTAYNNAVTAYNAAVTPDANPITVPLDNTVLLPAQGTDYAIMLHRPFMTFRIDGTNSNITYPTLAGDNVLAATDDAEAIEEKIAAADAFPLMRSVAPTQPTAAEGTDALALYAILKEVYDLYMAEMALHAAYMAAVTAEMTADDTALATYFEAELGTLVPNATGRDDMLHPYVVTITPKYPAGNPDIVLKIGAWEDTAVPTSNKYNPPHTETGFTEGVTKITIKTNRENLTTLAAGSRLYLPHADGAMIPASGFYLLTKDKDGSGINHSNQADNENKAHLQTPAQLLFNVRAGAIPNLETFFLNGGTLDLVAYDGTAATAAYISEVMWGSDASQADAFNSQWIEIANTTASAIAVGEEKWALWAYQAHETPPAAYTGGTLIDRIGTERSDTSVFWSVVGTGRSGRTNVDPGGADVVAIAPTQSLISMVRVTDAAGGPVDGTLPTSWAASQGPSVNFRLGIEGTRVATPGAADIARPTAPTPPPVAPTVPVAAAADIMITEIMVDSDSGRLPQWVELTHVGTGEVSLDGWEMVIDNAIDADVIGGGNAITVSLSGATLDVSAHTGNTGKGQSVLVVAWAASRHSANIRADRIINIATQLNQTRRYQLLSYKGFRVTLVPPQTGAIASFGDVAGNLDEEWELPMDEGTARSSIIRREMAGTPAAKTMGTDANGWMLASSTSLVTGQQSYYGADEDAGTPGQDSGGPLPVELSHFRPARDKTTGAVVITWATQSELNNAGFFIKRSNQRNGQFVVVNPTMVAGAGTTSEKQFYTYTDTTAQPNVVYYYQIEDVSLDGNRQTLTNGIRLKGHIGAAGKLTSTWGDLKSSNE